MALMRVGDCNHCGVCCLSRGLGGPMLENPMIELGEDRCKFYVDEVNDQMYGHCLIYGRGGRPIRNVRDRHNNRITDEQIAWFEQNCVDYPTVKDAEAGYTLPPECGFSFEVSDG